MFILEVPMNLNCFGKISNQCILPMQSVELRIANYLFFAIVTASEYTSCLYLFHITNKFWFAADFNVKPSDPFEIAKEVFCLIF